MISGVQSTIVLVLGSLAVATELFAFVDALRHRDEVYRAAGKRTKTFWLAITGVGLLLGFATWPGVLGMIGLAALIAAGVYLADVRPALRQITGGGRRSGPYGPW